MAKILIVDDDASLLRVLRRILEDAGHEVTEESNGAWALRRFTGRPSDLVITDIYMPDMDGIQFLMRVREAFPEARIIVMSGGSYLPGESVLEAGSALGADGILAKPFDADEVDRLVTSVLDKEVGS